MPIKYLLGGRGLREGRTVQPSQTGTEFQPTLPHLPAFLYLTLPATCHLVLLPPFFFALPFALRTATLPYLPAFWMRLGEEGGLTYTWRTTCLPIPSLLPFATTCQDTFTTTRRFRTTCLPVCLTCGTMPPYAIAHCGLDRIKVPTCCYLPAPYPATHCIPLPEALFTGLDIPSATMPAVPSCFCRGNFHLPFCHRTCQHLGPKPAPYHSYPTGMPVIYPLTNCLTLPTCRLPLQLLYLPSISQHAPTLLPCLPCLPPLPLLLPTPLPLLLPTYYLGLDRGLPVLLPGYPGDILFLAQACVGQERRKGPWLLDLHAYTTTFLPTTTCLPTIWLVYFAFPFPGMVVAAAQEGQEKNKNLFLPSFLPAACPPGLFTPSFCLPELG